MTLSFKPAYSDNGTYLKRDKKVNKTLKVHRKETKNPLYQLSPVCTYPKVEEILLLTYFLKTDL